MDKLYYESKLHADGYKYVCGVDESGKSRFESALFFGELLP